MTPNINKPFFDGVHRDNVAGMPIHASDGITFVAIVTGKDGMERAYLRSHCKYCRVPMGRLLRENEDGYIPPEKVSGL